VISEVRATRGRDVSWVEKQIRHHLVRASQRHGFGWKRWSNAWLYGTLGLFAEYRVVH
jgi:RNA-directed DNA polymerase